MMKQFLLISISIFLLGLISCSDDSAAAKYRKVEAQELASGVRNDSLFLGMYLGMQSKDFYSHCWKLNKQGLIRQGATNTSVYYPIKTFKHPASMDFYPKFENDLITAMPITFSYESWSPWNKHLFAEHLILEVVALMEEWYGKGFHEIPNENMIGGNAFIKIDGNRRISIYYLDDTKVHVDIVDLPAVKAAQAAKDAA